ncbi:DUF935 domain-containing protein [Endozoicomonas sp. SM1973]|uniref:DUF935 domain-containing protein n=1 Tax=Spartinivicinus marinus TaxID=2994442 RepID=A0A853I6N4_9GAMM|nr:DUF935 domain-containing protein [Spartinivicinus marinus]MCX4025063.1 DUF935 domain-containing protein [Spartinivicinus marinus]NYZ68983.1 DUF935 domain-containing protein [Spartinivicinus marinus]
MAENKTKAVNKKSLTREVAGPSAVRNPFEMEAVASGLTPSKLASVLQEAAEGDMQAYLTLAEEMEEREPHYASVLRTRKFAVCSLDISVEHSTENKFTEEIQQLIDTPEFADMMSDALDAIGKGFSVNEIIWDQTGSVWKPVAYKWRDPRYFMFLKDNPEELRIIDESNSEAGLEIPPYKFIVHRPRLKSGLTLRGGLARLVAFSYLCKMYGLKDWMAFLEIYGVPLRIGYYDGEIDEKQEETLRRAVYEIGSDAAAILPRTMAIEFQEISHTASGSDAFARLAEWIDRQLSKAVLGQTMTADDGSSHAQAQVHDEVRQDIIDADAKQLATTINRDLIKPYIDLNYGVQEEYPRIKISLPESYDTENLADNLAKLVPLGLKVSQQEVLSKLGLSEPQEGEELLAAPSTQPAESNKEDKANNRQQTCSHCQAVNSQQPDEIDQLETLMLDDWQQQLTPVIDPLISAIQQAQSYEELQQLLPDLLSKMDRTQLAESLAKAGFIAYGHGVAEGDN